MDVFIAVDDTDSKSGLCTTFLMTEIIDKINYDIIGNPRLVRLNPAVPWKTRGNASLVVEIGKGTGKKKKIGEVSGKEIFCYEHSSKEPDKDEIMPLLISILKDNRQDDSQSGLIVSHVRPDISLYWDGVRKILSKEMILEELKRTDASVFTIGNGQGIIGAACGMAWVPKDFTYELIAYRERRNWGTERFVNPLSIRSVDRDFPGTFNSWEERFQKVTMVPSTPCPVLYGLRGDNENELLEARSSIISEKADRWMIFVSNQGTDDHVVTDPEHMIPDSTYSIEGVVTKKARHIKGGHTLTEMETSYGTVTIGAYEPSKEFRMLFDNMVQGDRIRVIGELRNEPRTLNAEKVQVISVAVDTVKKENPKCPSCGRGMKSIGKGQGFRCRECHTKSKETEMEKRTRWIVPGWYEPPAAARRHLSKPLKRMGIEQPLDFVNSRIW